ncbi:hypothetical protein OF385_09320 [Glutamicibacter sp. JL.03c]|uniref:hypothetical protein n=1 Tax=Glutamicibacter sp. JL.03c TaxID=2984842 RepID=UPI0021F6B53E|nr:hypothetical protein [Glutamicibacter sp. JL.03c]UYQ76258.1 hypothetical protein OF385_09320 [Glutamicibacter sp. JL.03c]
MALRQVTREEWAAVPRTFPDFWLAICVWLPMAILLLIQHGQLGVLAAAGGTLWDLISFSMVAFVLAVVAGSGRQAPWLGLALTGAIASWQSSHDGIQAMVMFALAYYVVLAVLVACSDARFRALLRSWRREATGTLAVEPQQTRSFGITKYLPPAMWSLALGALAYPALRLVWQYFSTEVHSLADLDAGYRFDLIAALVLLALCFILSTLRWISSRSVGIFALEIPADVQIGPTGLRALGQAILIEQETLKCSCRDAEKNESKKEFVDPRFIFASDFCREHGIDAVNELSHSEFLQIADQPWVYGDRLTGRILKGQQLRMNIVGLTGWGSRPVAVRSPWSYGGGQLASEYYAPLAAREPLSRTKRELKVVNPAGNTIVPETLDEAGSPEIDRINLRTLGINAEAVRVAGARPFLA